MTAAPLGADGNCAHPDRAKRSMLTEASGVPVDGANRTDLA